MSVSGCTSCQFGSVDALKAYDRAIQQKNQEASANLQNASPLQNGVTNLLTQNQPISGAVAGSNINISA